MVLFSWTSFRHVWVYIKREQDMLLWPADYFELKEMKIQLAQKYHLPQVSGVNHLCKIMTFPPL